MIINVNSKLRIETNSTPEYTVQKRMVTGGKSKNAGQEYWKNLGHHGTLAQAITRTLDYVVVGSDEEVELQGLLLILKKHFRRVRRTLEGMKDESGAT